MTIARPCTVECMQAGTLYGCENLKSWKITVSESIVSYGHTLTGINTSKTQAYWSLPLAVDTEF